MEEGSKLMFDMVTASMFNGIFDEVIGLVPKVLPAVVSFLAFRKGWSFIQSAIQGA